MDEISASRHSSTTWCLLAVWLPELESKTEPELGHESSTACLIRGYRQLKDKKVMNIGYDKPLYLQPFDHRGSFQTKMFGWKGKLTEEQTAQIAAAKQVIYDGFKVAVAAGVPKEKAGILVDEQFGAAILRDAAAHAYLTACPVEKSGQDEFDFDYGEDFAKHIEAFRPTLSKVLVRYNPEGDEALNQRQSSRLRRLSDYLHTESHRLFMFELLVPAEKAQLDRVKGDKKAYDLELRPGLMAQAIEQLQDAGVEADVWKIEGLDRREDCERIVAAAHRNGRDKVGCILLGRGEDDKKVYEWLTTADHSPGLHRFRRRSHRLLGATRWMAGQKNCPRGSHHRDSPSLPKVRRNL
jgi:myo-inositol catabolism protein IolC